MMGNGRLVLVDTSVWVQHLRSGDAALAQLLQADKVLMHDMVVGELACGSLQNRAETLQTLQSLRSIRPADHAEARAMLEQHQLFSAGIGYVDIHLLSAVLLSPQACLYTLDKRLQATAQRLGLAFDLTVH